MLGTATSANVGFSQVVQLLAPPETNSIAKACQFTSNNNE